jgi:hypothetical protein
MDSKDPSALYLHDPDHFKDNLREAMEKAVAVVEMANQQAAKAKAEAWGNVQDTRKGEGHFAALR